MPTIRTIFIGDIHGCAAELTALLERLNAPQTGDHIIFVGDLFDRGPKPHRVLDLLRKHESADHYRLESVCGNHDAKLLDACRDADAGRTDRARDGYDAAGVDLSPHQLRHVRRNAPRARLLRRDVRRLDLGRTFDVVTCLFDSLNYLTTRRDLLAAFRIARRHLAPGGLFAFDVNTFIGLQQLWCQTTATHEPDLTLIIESSFDPKRALGRCTVTGFIRTGKRYRKFHETHTERGYHPEEIEKLLTRASFKYKKFDGFSLNRPTKQAQRLMYLCEPRKR